MTFPSSYDLSPKNPKTSLDIDDWDDSDDDLIPLDPTPDNNGPNHSCYRPGGY